MNLPGCQGGIAVKLVVGFVYQFEERHTVFLFDFFSRSVFLDFKVVTFLYEFGYTFVLFGNRVGHGDTEFHPVGLLFEAHTLHVAGIVGIIVDCGHCAQLFISFDEHPFVIHVGEPHRAYNRGHPFGTPPVADGFEQGVDNLVIVNKVHESETQAFLPRPFVDQPVDYACDAPYGLAVAESHEALGFAELERRVYCRREGVCVIGDKRRDEPLVAVVKVDSELHIFFQLPAFGGYFSNLYC